MTDELEPKRVLWTASVAPNVVPLTRTPEELVDPRFRLQNLRGALPSGRNAQLIERRGVIYRVQIDDTGGDPPAVLLPLDNLFDIRAAAALRLWRALIDRSPGRDPTALTPHRRQRLVFALRALDGRLAGASHREIAQALFADRGIDGRSWISSEFRDRTARLIRLGLGLMNGGYRRLLLHPYRRSH